MLADIVLGKRRHGGITPVDRLPGAGVEGTPGTIGLKLIERCLQDIKGFSVVFRRKLTMTNHEKAFLLVLDRFQDTQRA
jgi:hypothetical protein